MKGAVVTALSDLAEGQLQADEQGACCVDFGIGHLQPVTLQITEPQQQRRALFLHRSVSRYKPPKEKLQLWVKKVHKKPKEVLSSGCIVTYVQPRVRRPCMSFVNPRKPLLPNNVTNDVLGIPTIVLLANDQLPLNEFDEASHLCGVSRCINLEHLRWERMDLNFARNLCHLYDQPCVHEPRCIVVADEEHAKIKEQLTKYLSPKRRVPRVLSTARKRRRTSSRDVIAQPLNGGAL